MRSIMKKFVGFLAVSSIWLLPVVLPEIQAQQTATPPSTAALSPGTTIEELKSRRMAIESMTDIDATEIKKRMASGEVAVITGFQGLGPNNRISTLGRGGSDTSAVAVAAAVGADLCDIYTDVDGVYTTDPRVVPRARRMANSPRSGWSRALRSTAKTMRRWAWR